MAWQRAVSVGALASVAAGVAGLAVGALAGSPLVMMAGLVAAGLVGVGVAGVVLAVTSHKSWHQADGAAAGSSLMPTRDLEALELKAKVRGAFDVATHVDRLGKLRPKLERVPTDDPDGLGTRLRALFQTTATSLSDAFDLTIATRELTTRQARDEVTLERDALVAQAAAATDALEAGVDRVLAAAFRGDAGERARELGGLAQTLDDQLAVARRVDERLRELEAKARGDLSAHERYVTS